MSATIPSNMLMSDLLKATGYDCPSKLKGKTFDQSTEGDIPAVLEDNKAVSITENDTVEITPSEGYEGMKKVTASVAIPLEDNKTTTIDVSAYSAPVEIVPTAGNTAMKKATIALSNIPSGGGSFEPYEKDVSGYEPFYIAVFPQGSHTTGMIINPEDNGRWNINQLLDEYLNSASDVPTEISDSSEPVAIFALPYDSFAQTEWYIPVNLEHYQNPDPSSEGWYEVGDGSMESSQDTSVSPGKVYYHKREYGNDIDFICVTPSGNEYGMDRGDIISLSSQQGE